MSRAKLCFPLSFFSDACSPPTNTEKESLRHAFLAHFHTPGYFIRHVHAEPFTADRPNVALAVSSVGCVALYDAPRSEALWTLAYRVTLSTLNIDNSQTRSMSTVAAVCPTLLKIPLSLRFINAYSSCP
jgi:hypothetical protein